MKTLRIPLPPVKEQQAIVRDLGTRLVELGALVSQAGQAIALLNERRSALVSSAVTGQIDVRGTAAPRAE